MIIKIHIANKKDPAENRQDLLQIGIMSLWVQYSTRNMGLPSAKRKSDKTQIGLFIGGEVFHFGGDYDIIKTKISTAIPHNSKCRYGERGAAAAKPKAQIILDAAKVSAASGGNSEPKQGQRSQSARGFCPRSTMRVPQPDIIEHFGSADAVPQPSERHLELCGIAQSKNTK